MGKSATGQNFLIFLRSCQIAPKFQYILRKLIWVAVQGSAQRMGGYPIGAWSSAQTQIDAVRIQRSERAELFGHHQRRMVGQHYSTRTHTQGCRATGYMPDDDCGRGAGNARHVVVLCNPVPVIAQSFGMLGEAQAIV